MFEISDLRREFLHLRSVCLSPPPPRGGGGGYCYIFIHTTIELFLGVQNFEFQHFWDFFRKLNNFVGMKILWIFFGVITNWTILYILGYFLKVKVQNGGYFLGAKISNIY